MLTTLLTPLMTSALFATAPHPELQLKKMNYAGRGCPLQGVVVGPADKPDRFAFQLPEMYVEWAPGLSIAGLRSSCAINLEYDLPTGWQVAVSHVGMKAVATLSSEVDAVLSTQFYFSRQANKTLKYESLVKGPRYGEDIVLDNAPETPVWSSCGGREILSLMWTARLKLLVSKSGSGSVAFFSDMSDPLQSVDFIWRPCDAPKVPPATEAVP